MQSSIFFAWKGIYGGDPRKLLCSWHVDRAWRKNLQVIHVLIKRLMFIVAYEASYRHSISEFHKLMQQFITWTLSDFGEYFQTYYAKRTEQWAYCYRVGTPVRICLLNPTVAEKGQPTSADPVADRLWPCGQTIRADRPSAFLIGEKYLKRGVR